MTDPQHQIVALADHAAASKCAQEDCTTVVLDTPSSRCGGTDSSDSGAGCTRLFCDMHLFVTERYGYLCAVDHNNIDDRIDD